jgi:hypothetical protein
VAAHVAGLIAAVVLLGIANYSHFILSDQSDTMIVATCLGAIDCQLSGRHRWALFLWWLGSLGRPEVWPFLGLYSVWAWRSVPHLRKLIVGAFLTLPLLWFGIPALTAKSAFIAGQNALHSPREVQGNKISGTLDRFFALYPAFIWVVAGLTTAAGALLRRWTVVLIGAGVALWVIVECAFALHGWPAVPRYLFEAAGASAVLVGIAMGLILTELPALVRRWRGSVSPALATALAGLLVAGFVAALVPAGRTQVNVERADLVHEHHRTAQVNRLKTVLNVAGGAKGLFACGHPDITQGWQSILAWELKQTVGAMWFSPGAQRRYHFPYVVFLQVHGGGWSLTPRAVPPSRRAACRRVAIVIGAT